jgi:hypothetical protein
MSPIWWRICERISGSGPTQPTLTGAAPGRVESRAKPSFSGSRKDGALQGGKSGDSSARLRLNSGSFPGLPPTRFFCKSPDFSANFTPLNQLGNKWEKKGHFRS